MKREMTSSQKRIFIGLGLFLLLVVVLVLILFLLRLGNNSYSENVNLNDGVEKIASDFPMYPNSKVPSNGGLEAEDRALIISNDSPYEVISWYVSELESRGWQVQNKSEITPEVAEPGFIATRDGEEISVYTQHTGDDDDPVELFIVKRN